MAETKSEERAYQRECAVNELLEIAKLADDQGMRAQLEDLAARFSLPPGEYQGRSARVTKALALLVLGWPFDGEFNDDALSADEPDYVDLLDTGRDITDEGFCHLNKDGIAFVDEVLAEVFTPSPSSSSSKEAS